jgi:DNA-binding response OmpR family regulator
MCILVFDDEGSLARCLEAEGDDFVSKPVNKVILTAKIRVHARTRLLSKRLLNKINSFIFIKTIQNASIRLLNLFLPMHCMWINHLLNTLIIT